MPSCRQWSWRSAESPALRAPPAAESYLDQGPRRCWHEVSHYEAAAAQADPTARKSLQNKLHCVSEKRHPFYICDNLNNFDKLTDVIQFCQFVAETYPREL